MSEQRPTAVVTGGSSGIGAATGRALAAAGFHVVLGARRVPRLQEIADEIDGTAIELDVLDPSSVDAFAAAIPAARVLVNNAGARRGLSLWWRPTKTSGVGCGKSTCSARYG